MRPTLHTMAHPSDPDRWAYPCPEADMSQVPDPNQPNQPDQDDDEQDDEQGAPPAPQPQPPARA